MGTALYVRLMVYTGLSLFIIRRANVYLVVCVLTRITLHTTKNIILFCSDFGKRQIEVPREKEAGISVS